MWPHRDVWLLIIGMGLAFPVSMLANMFTPLFLNWFAKRTWASLNKRIAKLETKLAKFEAHPAITEVEDQILSGPEESAHQDHGSCWHAAAGIGVRRGNFE